MAFAALIPFIVLFVCFVGFKIPLTFASFIALLVSSVLSGTVFHASDEVWNLSVIRTGEITAEIGMILFGAFLFLKVAKRTGVMDSLAQVLREVNSNRVVQGVLLSFPMAMMIEGSSGFGTPFLVIAPLLMALQFETWVCILLPFLSSIVGTPFGALGTPIRLSFTESDPSHATILAMIPLLFIAPLLSHYLISKKLRLRESIWIISMSALYLILELLISKTGVEFITLGPAFLVFIYGAISSRFFFKTEITHPLKERKGVIVYAVLLLLLWIGKQIFLDRLIPGTHIRIFNPGYVFAIVSLTLMFLNRKTVSAPEIFKATFERSKRTLVIFFCLSFIVQQMRNNGGLDLLTQVIPNFFLGVGTPLLAWFGCMFIGTSTVTNLLLSKVLDPSHHFEVAAGSAIGVQLAFQSLAAMRSATNDQKTEKEILFKIVPISVGFVLITTVWCYFIQ